MDIETLKDWMGQQIWPQIFAMLLNDAYFKLFGRARELTGEFNGPVAGLIETGYVTFQTVAIRRLCDSKRDVISLRRVLSEANSFHGLSGQIPSLSSKLDSCDQIGDLVNNYVAHTPDAARRPTIPKWDLGIEQLTRAQKAVCQVAYAICDALKLSSTPFVLLPVPQSNIWEEFQPWVPAAEMPRLQKFWHEHNKSVNAWGLACKSS